MTMKMTVHFVTSRKNCALVNVSLDIRLTCKELVAQRPLHITRSDDAGRAHAAGTSHFRDKSITCSAGMSCKVSSERTCNFTLPAGSTGCSSSSSIDTEHAVRSNRTCRPLSVYKSVPTTVNRCYFPDHCQLISIFYLNRPSLHHSSLQSNDQVTDSHAVDKIA